MHAVSFVHLHVHSSFSDGLATPEELVQTARTRGYSTLALTDHNTLAGIPAFLAAATTHHLLPIVGAECAVRSRLGSGHLVVLCASGSAQRYLNALLHMGRTIRANDLAQHRDIYVTSSCLGGLVARAIAHHDYWSARDTALEYRELFGTRFYLEVQPSFGAVLPWILALGRDLAIPLVATNDVHYLGPHDTANQIGLHLATEQEMQCYSPFTAYLGALENAGALAQILLTRQQPEDQPVLHTPAAASA